MRTTLGLAAACACASYGVSGEPVAQPAPHWVAEMHRGWAFELNAGRHGNAAAMLTEHGVIVPEGGVDIVTSADAERYLQRHEARRLLAPRVVLDGGADVLHTAGTNLVDNTTYYIRMVHSTKGTSERWQFDTVVLSSRVVAPIEAEDSVPSWMRSKLHNLRQQLEQRDFAGAVASHFAWNAVVVTSKDEDIEGHRGPGLYSHSHVEKALERFIPSPTFAKPHFLRVVAVRNIPEEGVTHMLAEQTSTLTGLVHRCYLRWAGGEGEDARIDLFMASIGEGCEGPKCHGVQPHAGGRGRLSHKGRLVMQPPAWLQKAEHEYGAAFTAGDFAAALAQHTERSVIVPHTAARLIPAQSAGNAYLRALHQRTPAMNLTTRAVLQRPSASSGIVGSETVYHTLGVNSANNGVYYMRWTAHHDYAPSWRVATAVFGAGSEAETEESSPETLPSGPENMAPPAWMVQQLAVMERLYSKGASAELVARVFDEEAVFIPDEVGPSSFPILGGTKEIAAAIDRMHEEWAESASLTIVDAIREHNAAWDMIGEAATPDGEASRFYMRWVNKGGIWLADVVVSAIGEVAAWPTSA